MKAIVNYFLLEDLTTSIKFKYALIYMIDKFSKDNIKRVVREGKL